MIFAHGLFLQERWNRESIATPFERVGLRRIYAGPTRILIEVGALLVQSLLEALPQAVQNFLVGGLVLKSQAEHTFQATFQRLWNHGS